MHIQPQRTVCITLFSYQHCKNIGELDNHSDYKCIRDGWGKCPLSYKSSRLCQQICSHFPGNLSATSLRLTPKYLTHNYVMSLTANGSRKEQPWLNLKGDKNDQPWCSQNLLATTLSMQTLVLYKDCSTTYIPPPPPHTHTHTPTHTCTHTCSHTYTQFYPDRAVQREVMDVLVKCVYQTIGCPWTGQLKNWEVREEGETESWMCKCYECTSACIHPK